MQLTVVHVHVYTMRAVYNDAASQETLRTRSPTTFEQSGMSDRCDTAVLAHPELECDLRPHPVISAQQTISEGVRNI